jgi:hypothetical protein
VSAALVALLWVLLAALGGTVVVSARRWNLAALVNALASFLLAAASVPVAAALGGSSGALAVELPLWVTVAGLLHAVGMLGPYDTVWWWDHLTHTVSAALAASLVYAAVLVAGDASAVGSLVPVGGAALTVGYVLLLGIWWELVELVARALGERFDVDPVLVVYGWRDTAYDIVFDVAGAALVVGADVRLFVPVLAGEASRVGSLLDWVGVGAAVASVAMALLVVGTGPVAEWAE